MATFTATNLNEIETFGFAAEPVLTAEQKSLAAWQSILATLESTGVNDSPNQTIDEAIAEARENVAYFSAF